MAFVRAGVMILVLVASWVALKHEGSAHQPVPPPQVQAPQPG